MSDQLAQLAACSANFGFLARVAPDLGGDGASAESYLYTDPDAAATRSRRFAETLAKKLLPPPPNGKHVAFNTMIQQLKAAQVIPQDIYDLFQRIRATGNDGTHDYLSDNARSLESVRACFDLAVWWHRRETGITVTHTFTTPSPTGTAMDELRAMVARVESQLGELRAPAQPRITIGAATAAPHRWQGGTEVRCGQTRFLVHDPVLRTDAPDRTWTFMQAAGQRSDGPDAPVWLQGLHTVSPGTAGPMRDGLRRQAELLQRHGGRTGLPKLAGQGADGDVWVLAADRPVGPAWSAVFGDGGQPLRPALLGMALAVLADVAESLAVLHRGGHAHLALGGDTVLVARRGRRGVLRDIGLAGFTASQRTPGPYRAAEQTAAGRGRVGPPADAYQLSALLHHTCTGFNPSGGRAVPIGTVPPSTALLLAAALDPDPAGRPAMPRLAAELRQAATQAAVISA